VHPIGFIVRLTQEWCNHKSFHYQNTKNGYQQYGQKTKRSTNFVTLLGSIGKILRDRKMQVHYDEGRVRRNYSRVKKKNMCTNSI
jgi:hypothetical protein